jgi:lysophospholipase L1-like esterase
LRARRLFTLALLFACGQSTAMGDRTERAIEPAHPSVRAGSASVAAEAPADAGAPVATTKAGALDNVGALKHFFEALAQLDDGLAQQDVRVLQFGDSHTAADLETGTARHALQARFGDGGRGFIALGRPWRTYLQEGLHARGMTRDWSPEHGKLDHGHFVGDGCYGLAGVCLVTARRDARAWSEIESPASRIEVDYYEQPRGGSFDLIVDGHDLATVKTQAKTADSAFKSVDVPDGPHKIEVRARGDGEVRLFGVSLDRARIGLVLDALGINGARAATTLQWNEAHMVEQIRQKAPQLVVLAYGTNESADDEPLDRMERHLVDELGRIARAVPAASCMLLGPPDRAIVDPSAGTSADGGAVWVTSPRIQEIIEVERRVAGAAGCAFYDQLAAMGGPGTIAAWAEADPPRARRDRTHLMREGYTLLGNAFASDLLTAYASWRAEKGLAPKAPPPAPTQPPLLPKPDEPLPNAGAGNAPFVAIPL